MAKGWLVQESLVYISKSLGWREPSLPMLWHNKEDDIMISKVPQGKGKNHLMDLILEEKVNKFCMLNHPSMKKWVTMLEEECNTISSQREEYRCTQPNTSNV